MNTIRYYEANEPGEKIALYAFFLKSYDARNIPLKMVKLAEEFDLDCSDITFDEMENEEIKEFTEKARLISKTAEFVLMNANTDENNLDANDYVDPKGMDYVESLMWAARRFIEGVWGTY